MAYHLLKCLKVFLNERSEREGGGGGKTGGGGGGGGERGGRGGGWKGRLMRDCLRGERGVGRLGNEETGWRWSVKLGR